jgi:hypothetical protein
VVDVHKGKGGGFRLGICGEVGSDKIRGEGDEVGMGVTVWASVMLNVK